MKSNSQGLPVFGCVANLDDGRAEIYVQGDEQAVCAFWDYVEYKLGCYIEISTQKKLTEV